MKHKKPKRLFAILLTTLLLTCLAGADAEASDQGWQLRVSLVNLDPDLVYQATTDSGDPIDVRAESDTGFGIGIEYRFASKAGLEIGWISANPQVTLSGEFPTGGAQLNAKTGLGFEALTAAINLHFTPDSAVDFYVSPKFAYISYGNPTFELEVPGVGSEILDLMVESDYAWGLGAGFDVRFGDSPWFANGYLSYLDTTADFKERGDPETVSIDFDSLIIGVGIGYSF